MSLTPDNGRVSDRHARRWFAVWFFIAAFMGLLLVYKGKLNGPPIRSDGEGYYMYLPALLIDDDLTLTTLAERRFNGHIPLWTGAIKLAEAPGYVIKYPAGEALLLAPFFALGAALAAVQSLPVDGYSRPFQYCAALAGPVYGTVGLMMLWDVLRRRFSITVTATSLGVVVFGTNLYHYSTYDSVFSHVFSFFLVCALLRSTEKLYASPSTSTFTMTGVIMGLLVLVRPTNALWMLMPLAYGWSSGSAVIVRLQLWWKHSGQIAVALVAGAAIVAIQLSYWKAATGDWWINAYALNNEFFDFSNPQLANVLFSVRKGLFFWSPLWLVGLLGVWALRRHAPEYFWPIALFLPLSTWVIASWHCWWYGGSFGSRPYVEATPLLCICMASLMSLARRRGAVVILTGTFAASVFWSVWMMSKYWRGVLPMEHPTADIILQLLQSP